MTWIILSIGVDGVINLYDQALSTEGYPSRAEALAAMEDLIPQARRLGRRLCVAEVALSPSENKRSSADSTDAVESGHFDELLNSTTDEKEVI